MSVSCELLEQLQADALALLLATPLLANCAIIADSDGDTDSIVTKSLSGTIKNRANKYGLAVIVFAPEVTKAEKNLPGPPLLIRLDVQTLEHVKTNRGPSGTGLRSSKAAMIALSTLHLYQMGANVLYADEKPIQPLPVVAGLVSHSITLYLRAGGIQVADRPSSVQVALLSGSAGVTITGDISPSVPDLVLAGLEYDWPIYTANGEHDYSAQPQCYRSGTQWVIDAGSGASWRSAEDSAATPDLAGGWTAEGTATGTPVVSLNPGGGGLQLTCSSPSSTIRYTTDGSYPSPAKTLYSAPFALPAVDTVVRAAAYVTGMPPGDVLEFTVRA